VFADDVLVCPEALRRSAATLSSIARRLAYEAEGPPLEVPAEGLQSGVALAELTATVRQRLAVLSASTVDAAVLIRRAAGEYEATDERAVRRSRAVA
jgi:hypothetical protein